MRFNDSGTSPRHLRYGLGVTQTRGHNKDVFASRSLARSIPEPRANLGAARCMTEGPERQSEA